MILFFVYVLFVFVFVVVVVVVVFFFGGGAMGISSYGQATVSKRIQQWEYYFKNGGRGGWINLFRQVLILICFTMALEQNFDQIPTSFKTMVVFDVGAIVQWSVLPTMFVHIISYTRQEGARVFQ